MKNNSFVKAYNTADVCLIALASAFMCVCSWITVPFTIPFTMQTFAVFLVTFTFNDLRAIVSILVYILLGAVGLPVFSGFHSGVGWLFGPTGGYIIGFLLCDIIYFIVVELFGNKKLVKFVAMIFGLLTCYSIGTLWFCVCSRDISIKSLMSAFTVCVLPFVIPDILKLFLAFLISKRIGKNIIDTN